MMNQVLLECNSNAKTSDWIQQAKGCVIYAYDLANYLSEIEGKIIYKKEEPEQKATRLSRRSKAPKPPAR